MPQKQDGTVFHSITNKHFVLTLAPCPREKGRKNTSIFRALSLVSCDVTVQDRVFIDGC